MNPFLFVLLIGIFYFFSVAVYQKYSDKKLLLIYFLSFAGGLLLYFLALLLTAFLSTKFHVSIEHYCNKTFISLFFILMTNFTIILSRWIFNSMMKTIIGFHIQNNHLDNSQFRAIDRYKTLFLKWLRFLYLLGCLFFLSGFWLLEE